MLLASVLPLLLRLSSSAGTVTFTDHGSCLSKLVPELGAATGLKLAVAGAIKNEVACLRVENAPIKEVLDRLAHVAGAAWTAETDGTFILGPSIPARTAQRNSDIEFRKRLFSELLNPSKQKLADSSPRAEDSEDSPQIGPELAAVLRRLGPQVLAAIPQGSRYVYASSPTDMQLPLPPDAIALFTKVMNDSNERMRRQIKDIAAELTAEQRAQLPLATPKLDRTPTKVLLILTRDEQAGAPQHLDVELIGFDNAGGLIPGSVGVLTAQASEHESSESLALPVTRELRQLIQLEKSSRAFAGRFSAGQSPMSDSSPKRFQIDPVVKAEATARTQDPVAFDPLAYSGDLLVALAERRHLQLVSLLSDQCTYIAHQADEGKPTAEGVLDQLRSDATLTVSLSDGWFTIAPVDSDRCERERVDRKTLARLAKELHDTRLMGLPWVQEVALCGLQSDRDSVLTEWLELASPTAWVILGQDWDAARLFALLDERQRKALATGHLPLSGLSATQADLVAHMVYGPKSSDYDRLQVESPTQPNGDGAADEGYFAEPTEVAPAGLPPNGYLEMEVKRVPVVHPVNKEGEMLSPALAMPMTAAVFAVRVARNMVPGWAPIVAFKTDQLELGTQTFVTLRIHVASRTYREGFLEGYDFPASKPLGIAGLPEEFHTAIDKAVERLKATPRPPRRDAGQPPL